MNSKNDTKHLSDQVQNCTRELINESYKKNEGFEFSLCEIVLFLITDSNNYDYILNKYPNVNKELINRMILSNFLEITYYRRKMGIPLDNTRLTILQTMENPPKDKPYDIVCFDRTNFYIMLNDVILYLEHISNIYSYNAVQSIIEDNFAEKLYNFYPLAMSEHMLTLDDSFTTQEKLLFTLYELLVNATEKIMFSKGRYPMPHEGYIQELSNLLKEYNGKNPQLPNIHKEILDDFKIRTNISESDEEKMGMVEIIYSILDIKQSVRLPLSFEEVRLMDLLETLTPEALKHFFDENQQSIVSVVLNNWNYFTCDEILENVQVLESITPKLRKLIKDNK